MKTHLYLTDCSGFRLIDAAGKEMYVVAAIVPHNRHESKKFDDAIAEARQRSIPVYVHRPGGIPDDLPDADFAVSWMYSQLFTRNDLAHYPSGMLNMHGGRLPDYRGSNVLQWAIINGETEMGITWHSIVEDVDAGPIWAESMIPLPTDATAVDIRVAMIEEGIRLFPEALRHLASEAFEPRFADNEKGRVYPRRKPEDGAIRDGMTVRQVRDLVRALCAPWPPAYVERDGERLSVVRVTSTEDVGTVPYNSADGKTLYLKVARQTEDGLAGE